MIARYHPSHRAPHTLHDARTLMAEHDGLRHGERQIAHCDIGMAHARGDHAHQDLVGTRLVDFDRLEGHRRVRRTRYRCENVHAALVTSVVTLSFAKLRR